jgi:peptidoglycan/LPS O-acetylase OafA/YrhL
MTLPGAPQALAIEVPVTSVPTATQASFDPRGAWTNPRIAGRIAEVDGLRGVAILLVVFFHYVTMTASSRHPWWQYVTTSTHLFWSGVDLFFVLSGFLIAGILMDSAGSPRYFKTFYLRRFHRIFPLYFGWLALFYLGIYVNLDKTLGGPIFQGTVPLWFYPLFVQNNAPLWLNAEASLWMAMSWSLAVEEQFYVVLPSIVRFVGRTALAFLCGATIFLSPAYRFVLVAGHPNLNAGWPFATLSRLDSLAMGVAAAVLVRNQECWEWLNGHSTILHACGVALFLGFLALTYSAPGQLSMAVYGFTVVAAFYVVLLLTAVSQPAAWLSGSLRAPILVYFGKVSYAIYIFHQGVHALLDRILPVWGSQVNAARVVIVPFLALLVTILLSDLSWRLMESRLIKRAHIRYKY